VVCGDGAERGLLEARAALLDLPVIFTGYVPAAEALAAFDVLLVTSRNEGLPLAVVEALSAGVAVVAPPVGGLADLIAAGAVEAAPREARALAVACERLIDRPELRARRLAAGAALARSLAPAALAQRYDELYRAVHRD
jgi:glycosyltransferase involved in cell wall biosynthesis